MLYMFKKLVVRSEKPENEICEKKMSARGIHLLAPLCAQNVATDISGR